MFFMMRRHYGDWLLACLMLGTVLGTAAVNLAGSGFLGQGGMAGILLTGSVLAGGRRSWELIRAAAVQRLGETALLWGMGRLPAGRLWCCCAALYAGCSAAAVLSMFTWEKGVMGLPLYLGSVMPQALFYIPLWLFLAGSAESRMKIPVRYILAGAALLAAGIFCEGAVNPWIFRQISVF